MNTLRNGVIVTLLVLAVSGAAGCSSSAHPSAANANSQKGFSINLNAACMPADVARVVVAAPGVTASALTSLSPAPLAIVDDSSGTLAFFHTDATLSSEAAPLVSSSALVPTDPVLQSCNYLLSDVPAAQPFIKAAIAGAVADNLAPSAASLSASLAAVEIGDNPVTSGSLVIILLVSGVPQGSVDGHTVDGPESSIFVLLNRDTLAVTGTGPGTW